LMNANYEPISFTLPPLPERCYWIPEIDTSHESAVVPSYGAHSGAYQLEARSLVVLAAREMRTAHQSSAQHAASKEPELQA